MSRGRRTRIFPTYYFLLIFFVTNCHLFFAGDTKSRIKSFKSELHEVTQAIQEPALLKQSCISLHSKFVLKKVETGELDVEIKKEYSRQQEYLEKSVEALKRRLTRDSGLHRADNLRVMQANMAMVKEINKLRPEVKRIRMMAKDDSSSGSSNMMGGDPSKCFLFHYFYYFE